MDCKIMDIFKIINELIEIKKKEVLSEDIVNRLESLKVYIRNNICTCPSGIKDKCFSD